MAHLPRTCCPVPKNRPVACSVGVRGMPVSINSGTTFADDALAAMCGSVASAGCGRRSQQFKGCFGFAEVEVQESFKKPEAVVAISVLPMQRNRNVGLGVGCGGQRCGEIVGIGLGGLHHPRGDVPRTYPGLYRRQGGEVVANVGGGVNQHRVPGADRVDDEPRLAWVLTTNRSSRRGGRTWATMRWRTGISREAATHRISVANSRTPGSFQPWAAAWARPAADKLARWWSATAGKAPPRTKRSGERA